MVRFVPYALLLSAAMVSVCLPSLQHQIKKAASGSRVARWGSLPGPELVSAKLNRSPLTGARQPIILAGINGVNDPPPPEWAQSVSKPPRAQPRQAHALVVAPLTAGSTSLHLSGQQCIRRPVGWQQCVCGRGGGFGGRGVKKGARGRKASEQANEAAICEDTADGHGGQSRSGGNCGATRTPAP